MPTRRVIALVGAVSIGIGAPAAAQAGDAAVDPSRARLVFGMTGRTIPRGHGYLVGHYLFIPALVAGVDDRVTLVGGFALPPLVQDPNHWYWVGGKIGLVERPGLAVALGGMRFHLENDTREGLGYAVVTGDVGQLSATVAVLTGVGGDIDRRMGTMIGLEGRLGGELTLVGEAWTLPLWSSAPAIWGVRWSNAKAAFTVGLSSATSPLPYVDFAVHW